jgi:hypothetical protein
VRADHLGHQLQRGERAEEHRALGDATIRAALECVSAATRELDCQRRRRRVTSIMCRDNEGSAPSITIQDAPEEVACSPLLAAEPASCRAVRVFLRDALGGDGNGVIEVAELVVSELAANAVRHAKSPFTTRVLIGDGTLRVAVTDRLPTPAAWSGFPVDRRHGLGIVDALARDWGVQQTASDKTVWVDIDIDRRSHG